MVSTLLATKLYRPNPTSSLVARPRLTQRLEEGLRKGHPLILVVAPAGYGKTTLVSHWLGETAKRLASSGEAGIPSAWLLLDEADNDAVRFFTYVVAALKALDPQVGQSLQDALRTLSPSPEALVYPLINDLAGLDQPIVLALDDYHLITDALIQEAMALLLEHAPPNLHLVVLTRLDPPFPLPRLRVRERMTEIRDRDLRFTSEEVTAFLNSLHHLNLPAEQIAALESRTEGWVAGVQLAALSLQGRSPERAAQFIQAFSGSHHYVIDYLGDEVLRRQPDEVQSFLLQTSILDRLCGPLCDAVLGESRDSERMLRELERRNLFLIPLDDERHWYRYHHLFSDLLFQRLKQTQPDRLSELYLRAALWLEQNGYPQDGVEFALKAQDYELAIRLIEKVKYPLATRGELPLLIHWLNALPEALARSQPELCFMHASMLTLAGYFEAAEKWLGLAEDGFAQLAPTDRHAALRLPKIPIYRSVHARFRGDFSAAVALGQTALDQTPTTQLHDRAVAQLFLGQAHFHAGNTDAAEQVLPHAMQSGLASGHLTAYLNACHHLAQLRVLQGRLHDAKALCEQAIQVVGEQGAPVYSGVEHASLGDLQREWNQLEAATAEIEKGLVLAQAGNDVFFLTDVYLARVRLALAQRDWESAWSCIKKAEQIARRSTTSLGLENLRSWHARIHLAQGEPAQAQRWAETKKAENVGPFDPQQEFELLTLARLWLAQGKVDQAASLLERIRVAAEESGRHGRALEAQMLQALVDQAAGKEAQALERLAQVLAQAEPEGYVRLFVDEGEPMARLLQRAVNRGITPLYSSKLLAAVEVELKGELPQPPVGVAASLVEPLSERELEVLHLVAAGLSNREIADRLVVSVRTVKKHVQNILGKLGVTNRTAAVARGRELNLL
jgi:LuxR family maltose regulon positive regulatory protein